MRSSLFILVFVFILFNLTIANTLTSVTPHADCSRFSNSCTLTFAIDSPTGSLSLETSPWFNQLTTTSPCSISSNTLTITSSATTVQCTFESTTTPAPSTSLITPSATINTVTFPAKVWGALHYYPDCSSSAPTCTLQMKLSSGTDLFASQITLRTTSGSFKSRVLDESDPGNIEFSAQQSVLTATLTVSSSGSVYQVQFTKFAGCRAFSFSITSSQVYSFDTGESACGKVFDSTFADNCSNPASPLCLVTISKPISSGLSPAVATAVSATTQITLKNIIPNAFFKVSASTCATNQSGSSDIVVTSFPCSITLHKQAMLGSEATIASIAIVATPSNALLNNSPVEFRRVFTQPLSNVQLLDDCQNPMKAICTYQFEHQLTNDVKLTFTDPAFVTRSLSTITCDGSAKTAFSGLITSTSTTGVKTTCKITVPLIVRDTYTPSSPPLLNFQVGTAIPTAINEIPQYPPSFTFDPVSAIITAPSCSNPSIRLCTISLSHPLPIDDEFKLVVEVSNSVVTTPVALPIVLPKILSSLITYVGTATVSRWQIASTRAPLSTLTFPKGAISYDPANPDTLLFDLKFRQVGTDSASYTGPVPVLATQNESTVSIAQDAFMTAQADCLTETHARCTLAYQSFTTSVALTLGPGVSFVSSAPSYTPTTITGGVYTFTNLPDDGSTISFRFVGEFNLPVLPVKATIITSTTSHEYATTDANEFNFDYSYDGVANPQANCFDVNSFRCDVIFAFSNVNVNSLITFTFPYQFKLLPNPPGACEFMNFVSDNATSGEQTIAVTYVDPPSGNPVSRVSSQFCAFAFTKAHGIGLFSTHITTLMGQAVNVSVPFYTPYAPIKITPADSCNTYPDHALDFSCQFSVQFMGSEVKTLIASVPAGTYNWILPASSPASCIGTTGLVIAHVNFDESTSQFTITPDATTMPNGINTTTSCLVDITPDATSYSSTPLDLTFELNGNPQGTLKFTLPAPPTKQPLTLSADHAPDDPSQPIKMTFMFELADIATLTLAPEYTIFLSSPNTSSVCSDGSTDLMALNKVTGVWTITASYTVGATCTWDLVPTGRIPDHSLKHSVTYTTSEVRHHFYLTYPQLTRVIKWTPVNDSCYQQDTCDVEITITPNTFSGAFQSATLVNDDSLQWSTSEQNHDVYCLDDNGQIVLIATLESASIVLKGTQDIANEMYCTLSLPMFHTISASWSELTVTSANAVTIYPIRIPEITPTKLLTLAPTYCHFNQTCTYSFHIDADYLTFRPMFNFKSPIPGYWATSTSDLCDLTQIGTRVYLRVVTDYTTLSPSIPSVCSIYITPTDPAGSVGGRDLIVGRYHPIDPTQIFEHDRYEPPDFSRYISQPPIVLSEVAILPATIQPVSIIQARSCTNSAGGLCSMSIVFNVPNITRIRFRNFLGFTSPAQTVTCRTRVVNQGGDAHYTLTPSEDLQYVYLNKRQYETSLIIGTTALYPEDSFPNVPSTILPEQTGGGCFLAFSIQQTLQSTGYLQDYKFTHTPPGVFIGSHIVNFPALSPYGVIYQDHRITEGASNNWIKFGFNDIVVGANVLFFQRIRLEFEASLQTVTEFETEPSDIEDRTVFTQLSCLVIARETSTIRPRCTASSSLDTFIRGNPAHVYIDWSDNASSETVAGFYLLFSSQRAPTVYQGATMWTFTTDNLGTQTLQQFVAPPPLYTVPATLAVLPRQEINAWPYYFNTPPTEPANQIMYFVAEHQEETEAAGTSVRIRLSRPRTIVDGLEVNADDAKIRIQLLSDESGLKKQLPMSFVELVPINGKAYPVEHLPNIACLTCIEFAIIPMTDLVGETPEPTAVGGPDPAPDADDALYIDFIVKLRYVGGYTSYSSSINSSTAHLHIAVAVAPPINPIPLAPGHGTSDTDVIFGVESIIDSHTSWTTPKGQVVTYFFDTEIVTFDVDKSTYVNGVYNSAQIVYDVTPKPVLGELSSVSNLTPVTYQFVIHCDLGTRFDPNTSRPALNDPIATFVAGNNVSKFLLAQTAASVTDPDVDSSNFPCYAYSYLSVEYHQPDVTNDPNKYYLSSSPMVRVAALPPSRLRANRDAVVCDTTEIPILFASGEQSVSGTGWNSITLSVPSAFSITPSSGSKYRLTVGPSSDSINTYIISVQDNHVVPIYSKLTCPTSGSIDITSQIWSYKTTTSSDSHSISISRGYFLYTSLGQFNTQYELTMPTTARQTDLFPIQFTLYTSLPQDYRLYFNAPPSLKHQLFDITDYSVEFSGLENSDGLYLNARLTFDNTDSTRLVIIFDREILLFDEISYTRTTTPLKVTFNLRFHSPYFYNVISQICHTSQCSTSQVYQLTVVPPLIASWVLRFEQFTEIPSTIVLNHDMGIQDTIELTWPASNFKVTPTTRDLDYNAYSFSIVREQVYTWDFSVNPPVKSTASVDGFRATIAFSRLWSAQTPIAFPLRYIESSAIDPTMYMVVSSDQSILTINDVDGGVAPIRLTSTEFSGSTIPRAPISNFSYSPHFRSNAVITFKLTLGRSFLFGQQLTISALPLAPDQSITILLQDSESQYTLAATTALDSNNDGSCPTCSILTLTATSSIAIPADSIITFQLTTRSSDIGGTTTFTSISVTSQGFGVDSMPLASYTLVSSTKALPFYEAVSTVITKESVIPAGSTEADPTTLCTVGATCIFRVHFQQKTVTETPSDTSFADSDGRILFAIIDLVGFTVDTTQLPSVFFPPNDPIFGTASEPTTVNTVLYSFDTDQLVFSLSGSGIKFMTGFNFRVRFSASFLDGSARVTLRDIDGLANVVPDFYDSTPIVAPKVFPSAITPKFFHPLGGAFVGEQIHIGIIPSIPYQFNSLSEPTLILFEFSLSSGGVYSYPTFSSSVFTGSTYPVDLNTGAYTTVSANPRAVLTFAEYDVTSVGEVALAGFLSTYSNYPYIAANEPLVAAATNAAGEATLWRNQFEPKSIQATPADPGSDFDTSGFITQIPTSNIPFFTVRGYRAVQTVPSIAVLDVAKASTFNLTMTQKFQDGTKFGPHDELFFNIPPQYKIENEGVTTLCFTFNPLAIEPIYYTTYATITPAAYTPTGTKVSFNILEHLPGDGIIESYICPITVSFVPSYTTATNWAAINSETPLSSLSYTSGLTTATSTFNFYMPYPVRLPGYSVNFYGVETVGVPGTVEVVFNNVPFSPTVSLSLPLPFTFRIPDARSYQCRIPGTDSPIASVAPVGDSTLSLDIVGFFSSPQILCTFSLTPTSTFVHTKDPYYFLLQTTTTTSIPVNVNYFKANKIDPSPAIQAATPIVTLTADIVTGLTSTVQITAEKMSIIPGDTLSFSIGVSFTEANGSLDVSSLYCLSLSGEQVASVKFQYIGQAEFSTSPLPSASAQGQLGWASRVQLSMLISSPPATPWRCVIELKTVTDHADRVPDALVVGTDLTLTAYRQAVSTLMLNKLAFRPLFTFEMGVGRAYLDTPSLTYFEFFYNSTDVQLQTRLPASVELSLPLSIKSTPSEGLMCQLNHGKTKSVPFHVTAASSVAITFAIPTDRLVIPTEQAVNHVLCVVPDLAMVPSLSASRGTFNFRRGLIVHQSMTSETSFDFQLSYQNSVNNFVNVQSASNQAIVMNYASPTRVAIKLNALERLKFITPSFVQQHLKTYQRVDALGNITEVELSGNEPADDHFSLSFGCSIDNVDHASLDVANVANWAMYWSVDIQSWVTLHQFSKETVCYLDITAKPTAIPSNLYALRLNLPNGVSTMYNLRIQAKPQCWLTKVDFVRTLTLSSISIECGGFGGIRPLLSFSGDSSTLTTPTLNSFAKTSVFTMNEKDIANNSFITILNNACGPTTTTESHTNCNPTQTAPYPTDSDKIYQFTWLFDIDSSQPGFSGIAQGTYDVTFAIQNGATTDLVTITVPLNLSDVAQPVMLNPATIAISALNAPEPSTPAPRGKVTNLLLTVNELPRGETIFTPFIGVSDMSVVSGESDGSIFDYIMSPFLGSDEAIGVGTACYDPNNIGTTIIAYVSFRYVKISPIDPFIGLIVSPIVDAIEKAYPGKHGLSYQCVFPLAVIADNKGVSFTHLTPETLSTIALGASAYPITTRLTPELASASRPSITFPEFSTLFSPTFSGLPSSFSAELIEGYSEITNTAYLQINLNGLRANVGDVLVLQFSPEYSFQGSESTRPATPYRFYTPPFNTDATPCFNTWYPSGVETVGHATALSPQAAQLLGQASNLFALIVKTPRFGPYQELECRIPITTYTPIAVYGKIYGRLYTSTDFARLQQELRSKNGGLGGTFSLVNPTTTTTETNTNTVQLKDVFPDNNLNNSTTTQTDNDDDTTTPPSTLSNLAPIGFIGEPIRQFVSLKAALDAPIHADPRSPFGLIFYVASSPLKENVTLRVDLREYSPSTFSGCTSNKPTMSNVRFYGSSIISDDTQLILRIDLSSISEEDTIISCQFTSPSKVPELYWQKDVTVLDPATKVSNYTRFLYTEAEIANRPQIPVPVDLFNQADLTTGGKLVSVASKPIQSILDFGLQSSYTTPSYAVLVPQYYARPTSSPYIDGAERSALFAEMAQTYGRRLTVNHPLYTEFEPEDIFFVEQFWFPPGSAGDVLARGSNIGTLVTLAVFRGVEDQRVVITPYGISSLVTRLSPYGLDPSYLSTPVSAPFDAVLFSSCGANICGGECEPCPVADRCDSNEDCRDGLHCLILTQTDVDSSTTIFSEGKCVSESTYNHYISHQEDYASASRLIKSSYSSSELTYASQGSPTSNTAVSTSILSLLCIISTILLTF